MVNGIVSLIFVFFSLLVYRNAMDFCVLILFYFYFLTLNIFIIFLIYLFNYFYYIHWLTLGIFWQSL